jgi:hypothetical protein
MLTDNKKKEELRKEIGKILKHEVSERLSADRCKTCKQIDDLFALCESIRAEALKEVEGIIQDEAFDVIDNAIIDYPNRKNYEEGGQILEKHAKILATRVLAKLSKGGNNAKT